MKEKHEREKTLKDLLKPPFVKKESNIIIMGNQVVSQILTSHVSSSELIYISQFVLDALNNEWQRQFGEPKYWEHKHYENKQTGIASDTYWCPDCGDKPNYPKNYCRTCGVRLLMPKEKAE